MTPKYRWQKLCKIYFASFKYLLPIYHSFPLFSKKYIVIIVFTSWNRTNSSYHIRTLTCLTRDKSLEFLIFFFPTLCFVIILIKVIDMIIDQDFFFKSKLISYSLNKSAESTENAKPLELSIENWKLLHIGLEGNSKVSKQTLTNVPFYNSHLAFC